VDKMKKITFYDLFLFTAFLIAIGGKWNVYSCILLACAAILELMDVIPQIFRRMKHGKED